MPSWGDVTPSPGADNPLPRRSTGGPEGPPDRCGGLVEARYFEQALVDVGDCLEPSVKTKSPLNLSLPPEQPFSAT